MLMAFEKMNACCGVRHLSNTRNLIRKWQLDDKKEALRMAQFA
jgi:hypothetical protein